MVGWLAGWLAGWLIGWLMIIDWLADWLADDKILFLSYEVGVMTIMLLKRKQTEHDWKSYEVGVGVLVNPTESTFGANIFSSQIISTRSQWRRLFFFFPPKK